MPSPFLLIAILGLAGGVGWGAGWLLHRPAHVLVLPDVLQGVCGAALALEIYSLTGPFVDGTAEVIAIALVGAWVCVGVSHATAAVLRRLGPRRNAR